jgi:hypothetical protein
MEIPGHENYTIDESGNVFSIRRQIMLKPGKISSGYAYVVLPKYKHHLIHRLVAFTYIPNPDNKPCVDHIDGNITNNHVSNLRWATRAENSANSKITNRNTSGFKGVCFDKRTNKWKAQISINSKIKHIGLFDTPEEAYEAYKKAATEFHGEFARF